MEMVFNAAIAAILAFFLVGGRTISSETVASDVLGSSGVPMIFAGVGLVLLALSVLESRKAKPAAAEKDKTDRAGVRKTLALIAALLAYILAVPYLGFAVCTFAFSLGSVRIIGYRHLLRNALFSLFLTALLVVFFGRIFFIALPRGIRLIKEISYFLY